jgi:ABC-type antimicrobial peptide transport system permease subunit
MTTLRIAARAASASPLQLVPALRAEVLALDKDLALSNPRPLSQIVNDSVGDRRFQMTLLTIFAAVALTLAALGIYGLMAYSVVQRSREIGIRMALGADGRRLLQMIVGGALRLTALGIAIGALSALAGTRVLGSLLYEVRAGDPATLLITAAIMIASALLASWVPAWRATRVDPALPLRAE